MTSARIAPRPEQAPPANQRRSGAAGATAGPNSNPRPRAAEVPGAGRFGSGCSWSPIWRAMSPRLGPRTRGHPWRHDVCAADGTQVVVLIKRLEDARCQVITTDLACGDVHARPLALVLVRDSCSAAGAQGC